LAFRARPPILFVTGALFYCLSGGGGGGGKVKVKIFEPVKARREEKFSFQRTP